MKMLKQFALFSLILATLSMVTACGTVNGFGKDVSHAGRDIQRSTR